MRKIFRELGSLSGVILSTVVLLMLVFFVLNQIGKRAQGPLAPIGAVANFAAAHANGSAYGAGYVPVQSVPMYSGPSYTGPAL